VVVLEHPVAALAHSIRPGRPRSRLSREQRPLVNIEHTDTASASSNAYAHPCRRTDQICCVLRWAVAYPPPSDTSRVYILLYLYYVVRPMRAGAASRCALAQCEAPRPPQTPQGAIIDAAPVVAHAMQTIVLETEVAVPGYLSWSVRTFLKQC